MPEQPPTLLTVLEAAHRLSIGRTAIYDLLRTGQLESVRIGRARRIPATAIDAYVQHLIDEQHN